MDAKPKPKQTMPKLTKKHRTFDCDLNDLEQQQTLHLLKQHPTPNTNSNINNNNNQLVADGENLAPSNQRDDSIQHLSKLTLSSSLHQLTDSKFINNAQPPNHSINAELAARTNAVNYDRSPPAANHQNATQQYNTTDKQPPTIPKTRSPPKLRKQREANLDTVHVIVGNESCDLDSAVSCLLMFHIISKMSDEINGKDKSKILYIPLLNTTRDSLDSKCEVLWFLQKTLNIDKSFLTCKDDIDWNEIKRNGIEVLITLVDHNYNDEFKEIGKIVEIIDHHQVQNPQWLMENQSGIRLTLDTTVGSCATLVAERLFYIYAEHHVSDEILLLIYGTVLLDTVCLSEKAKRFTRRDIYLLKKLDSLLGNKRPVRDELYRQLVEVKNNSIHELDFEKLMRRDLKVYKDKQGMRIGIASLFGMAAQQALGLAANIDLDHFFRQNQYEAFIIMGLIADLDHSDSISRDLVLISSNGHLFDELCKAFELDTSKLDLIAIGSDSSPDPEDNIINNKRIVDSSSIDQSNPLYKARIWLQRNVTSSRKVVAPLVLKVLHDGA